MKGGSGAEDEGLLSKGRIENRPPSLNSANNPSSPCRRETWAVTNPHTWFDHRTCYLALEIGTFP